MGYEVQMFLGQRHREDSFERGGKDWFQVVATVDLSKPYAGIAKLAQSEDGDPVYMYASDGSRRLVEDCYGKQLTSIPAERVLAVMKEEHNKKGYDGHGYRRYNIAVPLLEAFVASSFKNPSVVLYGH